ASRTAAGRRARARPTPRRDRRDRGDRWSPSRSGGGWSRGLALPFNTTPADLELARPGIRFLPGSLTEELACLVQDLAQEAGLGGFAVLLGMPVAATLGGRLALLYDERMGLGPSVLADAGDLPTHPEAWRAAADGELVVLHLAGDVQVGGRAADRRQLVAEIGIEGLEPLGKAHHRLAPAVAYGDAVVEVSPLR